MFDSSISLGAIISSALILIGFLSNGAINFVSVGKYFGAMDRRLDGLDKRMEDQEAVGKELTKTLVTIGQQKTEINALSKRLDDVQQYGSHKLAEVLEALRGQVMTDFRDRFDFLQKQMELWKSER